ncbi:hypothetical protein Taro_041513 [Colocasia esculenta]|uniref:Uncharacterized protein n=1 Tax=Colocasia esculenta TaxID=4460 RepID=A0A843WW33_COLES|nr:hypothetical protein [Colocasia esculenta]
MAAERDRIARLQRELDEARSSLDQQAKEAAEAPEEEVTFAGGGGKLRQSVSSKAKEVERLKRKKPLCLYFAFGFEFEFGLAYLDGFGLTQSSLMAFWLRFAFGSAYLDGLWLSLVFGPPLWFAGYDFELDLDMVCLDGSLVMFGSDTAYLCGLLAMVLNWIWFGPDIAYLCGLLAMVLEFRFDIVYHNDLLAEDLKLGFSMAYYCGIEGFEDLGCMMDI